MLPERTPTSDKRKTLMEMVIANPDAQAPILKYKTARENLDRWRTTWRGLRWAMAASRSPREGCRMPFDLAKSLITDD